MFTLLALIFLKIAQADVVSTVAGQVAATVVTTREVRAQALMAGALPAAGVTAKLPTAPIDRALLDLAITLEAEALSSAEVKPDEITRAEHQIGRALQGNAEWKRLVLEPNEIREGLRRILRARKFVHFREDAAMIPVPEGDLHRYYDENRARFANLTFENTRENIKSLMIHSQVDKRLQEWFETLRRKYQVKSLIAEKQS